MCAKPYPLHPYICLTHMVHEGVMQISKFLGTRPELNWLYLALEMHLAPQTYCRKASIAIHWALKGPGEPCAGSLIWQPLDNLSSSSLTYQVSIHFCEVWATSDSFVSGSGGMCKL